MRGSVVRVDLLGADAEGANRQQPLRRVQHALGDLRLAPGNGQLFVDKPNWKRTDRMPTA